MEITSGMIYWITRLDALHSDGIEILTVFCGIFALVAIVCRIVSGVCAEEDEDAAKFHKATKWPARSLCVMFLLGVSIHLFVPTMKEAAAIVAIPRIASNKEVQEMPQKIVELANDWIEELKPNKD